MKFFLSKVLTKVNKANHDLIQKNMKEGQLQWISLYRGGCKMVVKTFKLGDTTIEIDDTYFPKSEEEKQMIYEEFNRIGYEILREAE